MRAKAARDPAPIGPDARQMEVAGIEPALGALRAALPRRSLSITPGPLLILQLACQKSSDLRRSPAAESRPDS